MVYNINDYGAVADGKGIIDANGVKLFNAEMSENKGKRGHAC